MFGQLTKDLEKVTESLFDGVMRGLPNDTLTVAGSGPWSFDGSFRRLWLQWKRNGPGSWLNPLPLFQYVDTSGTDPSLWKATKVRRSRPAARAYETSFLGGIQSPTIFFNGRVHPGVR